MLIAVGLDVGDERGAEVGQLLFADANAAWAEDTLADLPMNPDAAQALHFYIVGNTATTVTTWANWEVIEAGASDVTSGMSYQVFDFRLQPGSPCLDAGDNTAVPDDAADLDGDGDVTERTPLDLDGNPRFADHPIAPDVGVLDLPDYPEIVDMGPYEQRYDIRGGLDIKPGDCPNPFNRSSQGYLPVAVVGTGDLDVTQIDAASIRLTRADGVGGDVAPNEGPPGPHTVFEDVALPFDGEACDCHVDQGDGIEDLSMKFDRQDVVAALELDGLEVGDEIELVVTGTLLDGTAFTTPGDCILIVGQGP